MPRKISFFVLPIIAIGLMALSFLTIQEIKAQINSFTYFIPIMTDDLNDMYDQAVDEEGNARNLAGGTCGELGGTGLSLSDEDMVETIVLAIERDNTIVFYDHWEDGYEADLTAVPHQASTEIWGDGDPTNGTRTGPTDLLVGGVPILLQNTVTAPRNPGTIFYDGGDKLSGTGGFLSLVRSAWPVCSDTLFAGAWELYPTNRWGAEYIIPVGEDLVGAGPSTFSDGFRTVDLSVQAAVDNTAVEFDLNADGTFGGAGDIPNVTLNEGKSQAVFANAVLTGARVRSTNAISPVQVQILLGDSNEVPNFYEARAYTLTPRDQLANDYIAPRSSDGLYWIHNPNGTAITVNPTTNAGPQPPLVIAAGQTTPFDPGAAPTGARFQSADNFYGLVTLDASFTQDWGYSLQPVNNLTAQVVVGWGVGDSNVPPTTNHSRVYVTAVTTTTVEIDYNNDGITDTPAIQILPLQEVPITDPDFDLSGAKFFTTDDKPFVAVWGQDEGAVAGVPAIDVGTNVVPVPALKLKKSFLEQ